MSTIIDVKDNFKFVKGVIVDTDDPKSESRVKVRIPCYHGSGDYPDDIPDELLPWAQTCLQRSNAFTTGDTVWVAFEGGDSRYPIIFGQLGSTATFADDDLFGDGAYGIVGGEYDIEIDGVTYHVGGSTLAEMGVSIIKINEGGDYDAYSAHDVNGPSLGIMGFHAQALFDCLVEIRQKNASEFDKICKDAGASTLISYVQNNNSSFLGGSSSNDVTIPKSSAMGTALFNVMNSETGKEVQLAQAARLVQNYIDMGTNAKVTDNDALLFLADISNQGPYMAICESMRAASDKSLDNFYNMSKNVSISGYDMYNRRTLTYKIIKKLNELGALNGTGGVLEVASGDANVSGFLEILAAVWKVFVDNGSKWDYSSAVSHNYSIRGKSITARTDCSGYCSAAISVLCQETGNSYGKEVNNWYTLNYYKSTITGFQKLPFKYANLKAGDIVIRDNGYGDGHMQAIAQGYPNVKIYNCGGHGFANKGYNPSNWWEGTGDSTYNFIFRLIESSGSAVGGKKWTWPVPSCKNVSSPYGYRTLNGGEFHHGIDIPGASGAKIIATNSGTVVAAGDNARYNKDGKYICGGDGYGKCTIIDHGTYCSLYGHQSSISVKKGQTVKAGQAIGAIGNTGQSYGNHLHFEMRKVSSAESLDPMKFVSNK